jgi:hypothetical protein
MRRVRHAHINTLKFTMIPVFDLLTHHARRVGCDPRASARKAALGKVRVAGYLSDNTPIFYPGDAEFHRQCFISDAYRIRSRDERD